VDNCSAVELQELELLIGSRLRREAEAGIRNYELGIRNEKLEAKAQRIEGARQSLAPTGHSLAPTGNHTKANRWSDEDIDYLCENYANMLIPELLAHLPKKTEKAIAFRAGRLGLKKSAECIKRSRENGKNVWTQEDLDWLRKHYADTPMHDILARFPDRTMKAIGVKANLLGVRKTKKHRAPIRRKAAPGGNREQLDAFGKEVGGWYDSYELVKQGDSSPCRRVKN
jgi:hypothetical protein